MPVLVQVRAGVAVCALFLIVPAAMADDCAGFGAATNHSMGDAPYSVATADFNRDGYVDFVVANRSSNNVGVRLGGANGALGSQVTYATGVQPSYVIAADLNLDSKPDIATANNGSSTVSVLIGQGNGTFAAAVNYSVGSGPSTVAAGDLNRDGRLDLVTANSTAGSVSVLRGTANGFSAGAAVQAANAVFVVTGDFNRDSIPDLAVARFEADVVTIFLGNGDATFGAGSDLASADTPRAIGVGDFDRDGDADLAVANQDAPNVKIFLGAGNGTFAAGNSYTAGTLPLSIAVVDFTGDGKLDLAVANTGTDDVSFLTGNGDGTFDAPVQVSAGDGPRGVIGVVSDSGQLPVLVVANENSDNITLRAGASFCTTNCGDYAAAVSHTTNTSPRQAAVGDFNRDGKPDLAVPNSGSTTVTIMYGNGNGGFSSTASLSPGGTPESVAVGDFNRDGIDDVAMAGSSTTISVRLGGGEGSFPGSTVATLGSAAIDVATADFNLDGKPDLAGLRASGSSAVGVFLGTGTGTFGSVSDVNVTATAPKAITIADLNRDGKPDIVTANGGHNSITVGLGNGDGSFTVLPYNSVGGHAKDVVITDMNRDGQPDAVVARGTNTLAVLFGAGDGTFGLPVTTTLTGDPYGLAAVEGEYYPTILAALETTSEMTRISYSPADAQFFTTTFAAGTGAAAVAAVDLNRDGRLDAVVSNISATNISVLLNYCESSVELVTSGSPAASPTFTATVGGASALIGPTGTVTFRNGPSVLATVSLSPSYEAVLEPGLPVGTYEITATYNGDFVHASSTSNTVTQTVTLEPPTNVFSNSAGGGASVMVAWTHAVGAQSYDVYRSTNNGAFAFLANTTANSHNDTTATSPTTVYVYRIRSRQSSTQSNLSYPCATLHDPFVVDPIVQAGYTTIKSAHITDLRTKIGYYRIAAGLGSFTYTDPTPIFVKAVHFQELRTALDQAYTALGMPVSPPALAITQFVTTVQAIHLTTLRSHVRSAPYGGSP